MLSKIGLALFRLALLGEDVFLAMVASRYPLLEFPETAAMLSPHTQSVNVSFYSNYSRKGLRPRLRCRAESSRGF